jgi:EAL domain-containing protein (putative c-di-GMP-specific phosphodiesterase class I)/FixJ family two-component response regulator
MPTSTAAPRILLLDDDAFMLRLLEKMLAQLGQRNVLLFSDGAAALEEISPSAKSVDLIVLDINMPGMDGIEFIRRLVARRYAGSIALVSGESSRVLGSVEKLLRIHDFPVLTHLQKPVKLEELRRLMQQLKPGNVFATRAATAPHSYGVAELRAAIASGDLVNYYQPKVSLTNGEVVGVESLVRWKHPADGLIFPDRFIPLAADYGMMCDLTRTVLSGAMRQMSLWRKAGLTIPVAVNVSVDDLAALDFPDVAAEFAAAESVEPSLITLEVTEGQMMKQLSTALDVISRLRLKRFRLAIDDFGTGHSSLAQLRDLPFDELKIDRGFVHGASSDETLRAICSASLRMAQQLHLSVVAEGVETREDWDLLRELGCDAAQGYFIARPMPATDLSKWIAQWHAQCAENGSSAGLA